MHILRFFPVRSNRSACRGLTLVELLVVITIFIMLVAVVLPLAKPALKGRSAREASRQLTTILMAAQAKAISLRRPQGILLRLNDPQGNDSACYSVTAIQYPPPTFKSFVSLGIPDPTTPFRIGITAADYSILARLVGERQKFLFRIGNDFTPYAFLGVSSAAPYWVELGPMLSTSGATGTTAVMTMMPPSVKQGDTLRMFVFPPASPRYASGGTVQFPAGAYVDLRLSGVGMTKQIPISPTINQCSILFGPDGKVAWIHTQLRDVVSGVVYPPSNLPIQPMRATEDIHLLVSNAKRKQANDPLLPTAGSLWVSINPRTGGVRTSENLGSLDPNNDMALLKSRQGITQVLTVPGN